MALPATEAFTYADNSQLDVVNANWTKNTVVNGQIRIHTNQGFPFSGGGTTDTDYYHWNADTFANDQYSKIVINAAGNSGNHLYLGVHVRATGASSKKRYFWQGSGADRFFAKNDGTTETALGEDSSAQVAGDTWELDASSTTITAKINGSTIFTVTDSTCTAGIAGIDCFSDNVETETDALMDNWEGGNLSTGPVTIAVPAGAMKFADQTPWALVQDTYVPHLIIQNRLAP